jgi:hypothetical protein
MPPPDLRASDAEREAVTERLRAAATEGRLSSEELDERIAISLAARTHGELDALLTDLPAVPAPPARRGVASGGDTSDLGEKIGGPVFASILCVVIWAATGADYFWPMWVMIPAGLAIVAAIVGRSREALSQPSPEHRRPEPPRR